MGVEMSRGTDGNVFWNSAFKSSVAKAASGTALVEADGDGPQDAAVPLHELDGALADAGLLRVEVIVESEDAAGHQDIAGEPEVGEGSCEGVAAIDVTERERIRVIG